MTELEYDILDELYFVTHYEELQEKLNLSSQELSLALDLLIKKDWIKYFTETDGEENPVLKDFNPADLYFLASKKGLLAHNSR